MCILDHTQSTFFCLWKFLKKLADDHYSSITKESIYYSKYMYIQPFTMEVYQQKILHLMEVSVLLNIYTYCVFTLWGRIWNLKQHALFSVMIFSEITTFDPLSKAVYVQGVTLPKNSWVLICGQFCQFSFKKYIFCKLDLFAHVKLR